MMSVKLHNILTGTDWLQHTHLCIMANRSAVVRVLVGDRNTLSSSGLDSSLCGDAVLSLAVESVNTNQSTPE